MTGPFQLLAHLALSDLVGELWVLFASVVFGLSSMGAALARKRTLAVILSVLGAIGGGVALSDAMAGLDAAVCWGAIGLSLVGLAVAAARGPKNEEKREPHR